MPEVNTAGMLDSALQITDYQLQLNEEALPNDIWDNMSGNISYEHGQKQVAMPDTMYLKLTAKADDARKVVIPLIKEFSQDPVEGANAEYRGTEEDIQTKNFTMQYNDVGHVHSNQAYGMLARDKLPYDLLKQGPRLEGTYFKQLFGKYRRQMIYEGQSQNLLQYPHYNAAMLNPNWWVPGLADYNQPQKSLSYAAQVDSIVHAINSAGVGETAAVSIRALQRLQEWAFANLEPLDMEDGKQGFNVILPSPQITWLKHPSNERGLGRFLQIPDMGDKEITLRYPGLLGQFDRLRLIEDMRYPTLTVSGVPSASFATHAGAMTIKYYGMGRADNGSSDPRDKSSTARQLGCIIGKHAGCEWFPEKLHIEYDYKMYDKYFGAGLMGSIGMKLVVFQKTGINHANQIQHQGSAAIAFAAPPLEGYVNP
jgi:hypothetical protein